MYGGETNRENLVYPGECGPVCAEWDNRMHQVFPSETRTHFSVKCQGVHNEQARKLLFGPLCGDCGGASPCHATIQTAVDAASDGDTVLVAAGVYSDVHAYPRSDLLSTGVVTQVVYVGKSLTIRGGYTASFAEPPEAKINPTTLDARRQGRVLYVTGDVTPTIEGLRLTGGDAAGLGGHTGAGDFGGGVYVITATATFSNNQVFSNTAGYGGALACWRSNVTLQNNVVTSNTATYPNVWGGGGGLYLNRSTAKIGGNTILDNTTQGSGGGLQLTRSTATVTDNIIAGNVAQSDGGGLYLNESPAVLGANMVRGNLAGDGGGLYLWYSAAELEASTVLSNTAGYGGGLLLSGRPVTLTNTVIANNHGSVAGSGLYVTASDFHLLHTTIARNTGGDGSGIYVNGDEWWGYATASLTNTIVVSQAVGIYVRSGNAANLEATLWGTGTWANLADWNGGGTIANGAVDIWGFPGFADAEGGDYRITEASAALDAGIDSGVASDIDGQPRPMRLGFDIGADELPAAPVADFTHSAPDWLGQQTVFSNTTVSSLTTTCLWDFGDATTSTLNSPAHVYSDAGLYTVSLTASSLAGSDVANDVITVYSQPTVTLAASSPDWLGQISYLTATVETLPLADPSVTLAWDLGDGIPVPGSVVVSHTYAADGMSSAIVTATNLAGRDVATATVLVYGPPTAGFASSSPDWLGQTTTFTNTASTTPLGDPTVQHAWVFGDGGTSTLQHPAYVYAEPGLYTVTATATNAAGRDGESRVVKVYGPPRAGLIAFPVQGPWPLTVTFTSTTTTIPPVDPTLTYTWSFGDGRSSNLADPTYTYTASGVYTVTLTAINAAGSDALTRTNYITVYTPVHAGFSAWPTVGLVPLTVAFSNTSTGDFAASLWDFGDGITSTLHSPLYTYTLAGVYSVSLQVDGLGGIDNETRAAYITVARYKTYLPVVVRDL